MNNFTSEIIGNNVVSNREDKPYPSSKPDDAAELYGYDDKDDEYDYGYEKEDDAVHTMYGYGDPQPVTGLVRNRCKQQASKVIQHGHSTKRMQRRLSSGAMSCGSVYSVESESFAADDGAEHILAAHSACRAMRRCSLSNSLHSANSTSSCNADHHVVEGFTSIDDLKSRKTRNLRPKRMNRRASLSSIHTSNTSQASVSLHLEDNEFIASTPLSSALSAESNLCTFSEDVTEVSGVDFVTAMATAHCSFETLPVTNVVHNPQSPRRVVRKKKPDSDNRYNHILESLVWFSFHIPRTVLEDLILHELEVWKLQQSELAKKSSSHRSSKRSRRGHKNTRINNAQSAISDASDGDEDGSLSSLSEGTITVDQVYAPGYSENLLLKESVKKDTMIKLPMAVERKGAILFVDMSGFTKLSTEMDVESLSKVINNYFDMIVNEVIFHGGDILKFAGDAFFAEWKVVEDSEDKDDDSKEKRNPLSILNASLASISDMVWDCGNIPPISHCSMLAAKCAISIVKKFSDYRVTINGNRNNASESMLNVHCGVGVGQLVGLHVCDYKEGQEEDAVELRREFLLLGDPIDQISKAADKAKDGEVYASPEAILTLGMCCDLTDEQRNAEEPVLIASRESSFLKFDVGTENAPCTAAMQPYESLRIHCKSLNHAALQRLNLQMALYVHPVIREDELALSAAIQAGRISQPTETLESRHRSEAELRSVYTMFITPLITPRISGVHVVDKQLYSTLGNIMHVTSRELDRYSGHLRQFIVDDKGVVLIATFGLRGSTFPNMIENNCLPATFAIHRALKNELGIDNRVGATFGKVYCGVVGGLRRHEFACMGAPVNLAARLMSSKVNEGILVDGAVCEQCRAGYTFKSLPPVKAKGYAKLVPIFEPFPESTGQIKKKKTTIPFVGRRVEKQAILSVAQRLLDEPELCQSSICFLSGESGSGKSRLALDIMEDLKTMGAEKEIIITRAKSSSTETEQRIPLSSYRKIFLDVIRVHCEYDESLAPTQQTRVSQTPLSPEGFSLSPLKASQVSSRRGKLMATHLIVNQISPDSPRKASLMKPPKDSEAYNRQCSLSQKSIHGQMSKTTHHSESKSTKGYKRESDFLSQSLHRAARNEQGRSSTKDSNSLEASPIRTQSMRFYRNKTVLGSTHSQIARDDSSACSIDTSCLKNQISTVPYFEKLCWACEQLDYPYEYADIVGSQFLGFESATPITHIDGHIPTMEELVEFLALAFICIADFANLTAIFLDDFQWVDSFSWKIFRLACTRVGKILLICSTRSHDKQALRRITCAGTPDGQLHSLIMEISLGPIDVSDIRELMSKVLSHKKSVIPESLCTDIFQWTGGLPVYVVQLLENIRRTNTLQVSRGTLQWTEEGLKQKKNMALNQTQESFLSRFDSLDVRMRKVLQICAVLGLSFELRDVVHVASPEINEGDIESALNTAIDEMILVEQVEDNDDDAASFHSSSIGTYRDSEHAGRNASITQKVERFFQFSHAMWRENVLSTMLKDRKTELHRKIAESMEDTDKQNEEDGDISRLLTLFDHWKAVGDFSKVAPLALAVGSRLEEWDLPSQSLELYEDALEMAYDGVETSDRKAATNDEWIRVKARPVVLDLILRLHICIGLCHQRLGDEFQSILFFEDAYNIIKTSSKLSSMSKSLTMPIISSLCVLKLELDQEAHTTETATNLDTLISTFVEEAKADGRAIHIGRSLAMKASYHAANGEIREAFDSLAQIDSIGYDVASLTTDMIAEYGRDFVIEGFAESAEWLYMLGLHHESQIRADQIVENFVPLLDQMEIDNMMYVLFPVIQVYALLERSSDALKLLKKYVIDPYQDAQVSSEFWSSLFDPLVYLLEIIVMDEMGKHDDEILKKIEEWILDDSNSDFDEELKRKAHTIMGEICWRLVTLKDERGTTDNSAIRDKLEEKAREFLFPIAHYEHCELFQREKAQALLECL